MKESRKLLALLALFWASPTVAGEPLRLPVLAPATGILAIEGTSQKNGAALAVSRAPKKVAIESQFLDTASSPQIAVQAFERALRAGPAVAISAPIFGPEMLALMPLANERGVPLVTVSGTAKITEMGNPWVFRFFPGDAVVKTAQVRYATETLGRSKAAIVFQTTAYGQSGRQHLVKNLEEHGAQVVFEEGLAPSVKDMLPTISKLKTAGADVILLQLHSGPTARFVKQAAAAGIGMPIVAGSAMHQPSTAALLEPAELKGVCAESGSSPVSDAAPRMAAFAKAYRKAFGAEPDAFAAGQYDGVMMVLDAIAKGARKPKEIRNALSHTVYKGIAMTYKSDGKGNMAHDALIVCYDGASRVPKIVERYRNLDGVQ